MARAMPGYKIAFAKLLACEDFPQTCEFQAEFKTSVETALGAEDPSQYKQLEDSVSATARLLLDETRAAYKEGWRRVCAVNHPQCVAAVRALAQSPAVPPSFRRTVEKELSYAFVCADPEQFEQLLLGSSSTRLPVTIRKQLSDAMLAFDAEKARLDRLACQEKQQALERAMLAKLSQDAWNKAQAVGPEKREKETEEAKESRRIAKARLRGRRKNMDHSSLCVLPLSGTGRRPPPPKKTALQMWQIIRFAVKNLPALKHAIIYRPCFVRLSITLSKLVNCASHFPEAVEHITRHHLCRQS